MKALNLEFSKNISLEVCTCVVLQGIEPLVKTINDLSCDSTTVQPLCAYEERELGNKTEMQEKFFEVNLSKIHMNYAVLEPFFSIVFSFQLISQTFKIKEVPLDCQDETYRSEDIHLLTFTPKTLKTGRLDLTVSNTLYNR